MEYLEKERTLIRRDENGNVIPIVVTLDLLDDKPKVKVTPLLKGEIQKMVSGTEEEREKYEEEIVIKHCVEPKYTEEEIEYIQPEVYGALKIAILSVSTGRGQKEIRDETMKQVLSEVELKKKS